MGRKLNCGTNKYIPKVSQINRHSHKNDGWFHLKQNQTQAGRADRGHGRMDGEDMDTTHYTLCWFLLWLFKASLNSKHVLFFFVFCILYQKLEKVRVWVKPGPPPVFRNRLVWHTVTATRLISCPWLCALEGWTSELRTVAYEHDSLLGFFLPKGLQLMISTQNHFQIWIPRNSEHDPWF